MATLTPNKVKEELACITFQPRPNQHDRNDQQQAFYDSDHEGLTLLLGGNGCLEKTQEVFNPATGQSIAVSEIDGPLFVWARDHLGRRVIAKAEQPHPCGIENLYEFTLSDGGVFRATLAHRVLTNQGWREIGGILRESNPSLFRERNVDPIGQASLSDERLLLRGDQSFPQSETETACVPCEGEEQESLSDPEEKEIYLEPSSVELPSAACQKICLPSFLECGRSLCRIAIDLIRRCFACSHPCDEQLQLPTGHVQESLTSQVDALERIRERLPSGFPACESSRSHPCQDVDRLSKTHCDDLALHDLEGLFFSSRLCSRFSDLGDSRRTRSISNKVATQQKKECQQSPGASTHHCTLRSLFRSAKAFSLGVCRLLAHWHFELRIQPTSVRLPLKSCGASILSRLSQSSEVASHQSRESQRSESLTSQTNTTQAFEQSATHVLQSSEHSWLVGINDTRRNITSIRFISRDVYWDFHVPVYENYWMEGVWHHNSGTTTCGLAKAVKFMTIDQPAPRRDTPFWIIAGSYPQVMNACWKEKLHQKGHLDPNAVDWKRISWYKPNQDWPFSVPLKPRKNSPGKNWLLCFKSYEQGREAMQAEAIGGFLFVEQFPWGLLNEVMRGCREYSFKGNKLAEFTPVDPSLSIELRDMEETGKLPASWGLYRANTRCALEAGQISATWYRDFFAMIPDAMKPVREQGLWGNFEGAVYPEFTPAIHCTPEGWDIPPGAQHRRAVDFGFSTEHAFCCLWSASDSRGRIWIYDEYYSKDTTMSVIDHWKAIEDRNPWPKNTAGRYGVTWMDHDLDAIRTLAKIHEYTNGEYTAPNWSLAVKSVNEGIEYVKYLLKPSIIVAPNEPPQPRLKIVRERCPNLMREMITYRRPKQLSESVNANAVSQDPVKINDDTVDCLRYITFSEASMSGVTPTTLAKQHSTGSTQLDSPKFKKRGRRK